MLQTPTLPAGPIRIMGHLWRIEVTERPNPDDPEYISWRSDAQQVIRVADSLLPQGQAFQIWYQIWSCIYGPLVWGNGEPDTKAERNAIARAMWAAIRDNAPAIAQWFGLLGTTPEVVESQVMILGQPWRVRRVPYIPGNGSDVYGLQSSGDYTLYVRSDLSPTFAAEVALHEMTHEVVRAVSGLGDDEPFVRPMTMGIAQVFFDNPEAMAALIGVARKEVNHSD